MSEERLVEIESRLAHQDDLLLQLNDVITKQQEKIKQLDELCAALVRRVRAIGESLPGDGPGDERPPHY